MANIYYNGNVITMDEDKPTAEAVVVKDGKIVYVGTLANAQERYKEVNKIDLEGKTIMPSFIDAHSHFSSMAISLTQVNLEHCESLEDIRSKIEDFISENNIKKGEWIIAKGYDQNKLPQSKHPTKEFLDSFCNNNPIILQHASGHMGVLNSIAIKELNINKASDQKLNTRINIDTGYIEEEAYFEYVKKVPMLDMKTILELYSKAQKIYASYGITTVQEGMTVKQSIPLLKELTKSKKLRLDLVAYCDMNDADEIYESFKGYTDDYKDNFRLGGYKIFLDGSPQGRTAWMKTPYLGEDKNYYGNSVMTDQQVYCAVKKATETSRQILAHCNGDAACEQFITAVEEVSKKYDVESIRPVIVHAQLIDTDDLERVKQLNMIPSFFVAHIYHWGDVHINNFGNERACEISPAKSAEEKKIRFTFHQDSPVIAPDMFETIWCAVNRETKDGIKLGKEQAIDVLSALEAVTINAAYQYGEEINKGSLSVGKNADMIILDKNPLNEPHNELKMIKILETIKDGKTIFKKE